MIHKEQLYTYWHKMCYLLGMLGGLKPHLMCEGGHNNNPKHGWLGPPCASKATKTRACLLVETGSNHALRPLLSSIAVEIVTKE